MKLFWFSSLLTTLLLAQTVEAQPLIYTDASFPSNAPSVVGFGVGHFFGRGAVQLGIVGDIYHSSQIDPFAPDIELFVALGWTTNDWYLMGALGAGVAVTHDQPSSSVRSLFIFSGRSDVTVRASLFTEWTPGSSDVFLQTRFGPSIRLGQTPHRIFPNLAFALDIPSGGASVTGKFIPGCLFIFNL